MTQLGARVFTAPHEALLDNIDAFYPCKVVAVTPLLNGKYRLEVEFTSMEGGPYGRIKGDRVSASPAWVYPVECVKVEGERTEAFPYGIGTTILNHSWVVLPTLPDVSEEDDPLGRLADDGGLAIDQPPYRGRWIDD